MTNGSIWVLVGANANIRSNGLSVADKWTLTAEVVDPDVGAIDPATGMAKPPFNGQLTFTFQFVGDANLVPAPLMPVGGTPGIARSRIDIPPGADKVYVELTNYQAGRVSVRFFWA